MWRAPPRHSSLALPLGAHSAPISDIIGDHTKIVTPPVSWHAVGDARTIYNDPRDGYTFWKSPAPPGPDASATAEKDISVAPGPGAQRHLFGTSRQHTG